MKFLSALFLSAILTWAFSSPAQASGYKATYDVYAGGVHALQARLSYTETPEGYEIDLASETYGLLGRIIRWHGAFSTKGWIVNGRYQPREHISDTTSRNKHEINTYRYDKGGKFLYFKQMVNGKDETRTDLGDIMQGTTDVLSANFDMMRGAAVKDSCANENMIFDSERSYRLTFRNKAKDKLAASQYSSFAGNALSCTAEVKPEGGKWHKKPRGWLKIQEQGRSNGAMPTIWYANLLPQKNAPAVPVRILIKSNYGTFIAHLTSFEENGRK